MRHPWVLTGTILPTNSSWHIASHGSFKNSAFFSGLMLDYCAKRPQGLQSDKLASMENPIAPLINGLTSNHAGYWGTAGTVKVLRGLLELNSHHRLNATYQLDNQYLSLPQHAILVQGHQLTAQNGNGLVARIKQTDPLEPFQTPSTLEKSDCQIILSWVKASSPLQVGKAHLLEIRLEGGKPDNPIALITLSGLLRLEDQLDEGMGVSPGSLELPLPGRWARVAFRAIRPGSGTLRVKVNNMYDLAENAEEHLTFTVR
jgi:hypothetical protein